ncbi:MAG: hypothetical protein KDB79_15585 [Acidobacteria bacterium]|nr:hypothetical protein [Acidobacteriota bacterium]
MIEIELTEPNESDCECCGGTTTNLTRFVYKEGDAYAIYYATFSNNHPEASVTGVISIGGWDTDDIPEDRVAFPFRIWESKDDFNVGLTSVADSPWNHVKILGKMLDREEALSHPWINEVFHITEHITDDDPVIKKFFNHNSPTAN